MNALDLIDQQLQKAAEAPKGKGKPIFLFLKEGHKAIIRPLYDLKDAIPLMKHNLWSEDPVKRVNAVCASELGKPCVYCKRAVDDKKLTAQLHFYIPVHVYSVLDQNTGGKVTYKEKTEDGSEVTKIVQGPRLLELTSFGKVGKILKTFREYMRDENLPISDLDWTITQVGSGQQKDFVPLPKAPKPMADQLKDLLQRDNFKPDALKQKIIESLPPETSDAPLARGNRDTDPALEAVNVPQPASEEAFDDTIADF